MDYGSSESTLRVCIAEFFCRGYSCREKGDPRVKSDIGFFLTEKRKPTSFLMNTSISRKKESHKSIRFGWIQFKE